MRVDLGSQLRLPPTELAVRLRGQLRAALMWTTTDLYYTGGRWVVRIPNAGQDLVDGDRYVANV